MSRQLSHPQQGVPDPEGFLRELFAAVDAMDPVAFSAFLTEDSRFRFGNQPPVCGHADIEAAVGAFFQSLSGLRHSVHRHWAQADTLIAVGDVTYTLDDGRELTLPFAIVLGIAADKIRSYDIYADVSPLFAGVEQAPG